MNISKINLLNDLPATVRHLLLVGSVGRRHLARIAAEVAKSLAVERGSQRAPLLVPLLSQILLAAWEEDPLHPGTAEQLWQWHSRCPFLDEATASVVRAVCEESWLPSDSPTNKTSLTGQNPLPNTVQKIHHQVGSTYRTLYWQAIDSGNYEEARNLMEDARWPQPLDRLRHRYLASLYWFLGMYARWEEALIHGGALLSDADRCFQLGNLALIKGERRKALALWSHCLRQRPWFTQLILKMYDIAQDLDRLRQPLKGRVSICLYTYNKAEELQHSLKSLAESQLGSAKIFVLVNGSTDDTRQVVSTWRDGLGSDRLCAIDLPINIGAPAARNWLMHDPHVNESDWIAYLDDDALVPPDWLEALGSAVARYPNAGVWGCRVIDAWVPSTIQAVDYHMLPPSYAGDIKDAGPFLITMLHYETPDQGQFDYMRPCLHVTGCCHLFSAKTLLESGDFDLRFSPSQFDDLEHDIRLAFNAKPAIYQGHLAVRHMNKTGKRTRAHPGERGSAGANLYKLHQKYSKNDYRKLIAWNMGLIEQDIFQKLEEMDRNGIV